MDEQRRKRIEAGKVKLEAHKKRKSIRNQSGSSQNDTTSSDSSLSFSPVHLPDNSVKSKEKDDGTNSQDTTVSRNIETNSENDRSLQEIIIENTSMNSVDESLKNMFFDINEKELKLNDSLLSDSTIISLNALERFQMTDVSISDGSFQNFLDEVISEENFEQNIFSKDDDFKLRSEQKNEENVRHNNRDGSRSENIQIMNQSPTEADSLKEIPSSNLSTVSLGTSTTEYKQYFDKSLEAVAFQDVLCHKDDQINQLTQALQQVIKDRDKYQEQTKSCAQEINALQQQLIETTTMLKNCNLNAGKTNERSSSAKTIKTDIDNKTDIDVNTGKETSIDTLYGESDLNCDVDFDIDNLDIIDEIRDKIHLYIKLKIDEQKKNFEEALKDLQNQIVYEKSEHNIEVDKLRVLLETVKSGSAEVDQLRQELQEKHEKEMEELRTYFEQRCAVMEKNYSEEIFSQQSKKLSESSSGSDLESESFGEGAAGQSGEAAITSQEFPKSNTSSRYLELQSKYEAELELLREGYETRFEEMKSAQNQVVEALEEKYCGQLSTLKMELEVAQRCSAVQQEVANSGDFEIAEVVESYERRLQEQIMLAKLDIMSALEQQIQTLVSNPNKDCEWPPELLQIRERLFSHWETEIQDLKHGHELEIILLKQEHDRALARAVERERRGSLKIGDENSIKKERDKLQRVKSNFCHVITELMKHFTKCEDELNNTLVETLVKNGFDKDLSKMELDLNDTSITISDKSDVSDTKLTPKIKRVHFTPDVSGLISLIDENNLGKSEDISSEFQSELNLCLERLKQEANAILCLSSNLKAKSMDPEIVECFKDKSPEEKLLSLTNQLITETQVRSDLMTQLQESKEYIQSLESEKFSLESQIEELIAKQQVTKMELDCAKAKISDLIESSQKEIVSEGYGENKVVRSTVLGGRIASLAELQERARNFMVEGVSTKAPVQVLIEELCSESDRIVEDAKKDHEDLIDQIQAADKKLRATTKFLEEQAVERELERDEAQKEIALLKEQIHEADRNRITCERINKEVEQLEVQMREMSSLMAQCEQKKNEVENELKQNVDKIWVLHDIIKDLESQIESNKQSESNYKKLIEKLQNEIREQSKIAAELSVELNSANKRSLENKFSEHITRLEDEVQRLRLNSELVGPEGVLIHMHNQLSYIEKSLDKSTKDLEGLYISIGNTNCSSQSEDMSIKEHIHVTNQSGDHKDMELPLEQLSRLKDKLLRHSRAEDAAMKRIRDLEMQLCTSKHEFEEMQSERDVLQEQLSEQMIEISSLQVRLDEQRLRVESVQKQTNNSLERKIYDLENEVQSLNETIIMRDKNIKQLNLVIEQTKLRLADQQKQLSAASNVEKQIVTQVQSEIHQLKSENAALQNQIQHNSLSKTVQNNQLLPELLDSLLTEKNFEIDSLKGKLLATTEELDFYNSLNISKEQLTSLSQSLSRDSKSSRKFLDNLTYDSEPDILRKQEQSFDSLHNSDHIDFKRNENNDTIFAGSSFRDSKFANKHHSPFLVPGVSTIEKVDLQPEKYCDEEEQSDSLKHRKRVHFEESVSNLQTRLEELHRELEDKNETIKTYENKILANYMVDLEKLKKKLEYSEETLRDTSENYKEEIELLRNTEKTVRVELAEAKMEVQENKKKLEELEKDNKRKDEMYMNLAKERRELQYEISELHSKLKNFKNYEHLLIEKNKEIFDLEQQLAGAKDPTNNSTFVDIMNEKEHEITNLKLKISQLENKVDQKLEELNNVLGELEKARGLLLDKDESIDKLNKDYKNLLSQVNELNKEIEVMERNMKVKTEFVTKLQKDLDSERKDKECLALKNQDLELKLGDSKMQLESQRVEARKLSDSVLELERAKIQKEFAEKELQSIKDNSMIEEYHKEIHHLQELLKEKDKIINQMAVDSKSLHLALEAIQSKIQESGNVVDLKKRLHDEQTLAAALHEQLEQLKQRFSQQILNGPQETYFVTTINDGLERERKLSAELETVRESLMNEIQLCEQKLEVERENVNHLQQLLDAEKRNSNTIQLQDANIIESMRLRLEAALDHENEYEQMLDKERMSRLDLEAQVNALPQPAGFHSLDSKLSEASFQLTCTKMDLVKSVTENEILTKEIERLKNIIALNKSEIKDSKKMIEKYRLEIEDLNRRIEKLMRDMNGQDLEGTRLNDLEQENKSMKKQVDELKNKMNQYQEREKEIVDKLNKDREAQFNSPVPEKFLNKIKELTSLLQEHVADNKQMSNTLAQLTNERNSYQNKVKDLERQKTLKSPFDDPVARADHLFGQYLKSESNRRALVFQKRYLLSLLASYQNCNPEISALNLALPYKIPSVKVNKFRIAVIAVISIQRMKYIVQRWHTGKRIGASMIMRRPIVVPESSGTPIRECKDTRPVFGNSPPCKDRSQHRETSTVFEEHLSPLHAPTLLSQYIERIDSIQQRLGIALQQSPS